MGACATKPKVTVEGEAAAPAPLEEPPVTAADKAVEPDVIAVAEGEPEQPDSSRSRSLSVLLQENEEIITPSETEVKDTTELPKSEPPLQNEEIITPSETEVKDTTEPPKSEPPLQNEATITPSETEVKDTYEPPKSEPDIGTTEPAEPPKSEPPLQNEETITPSESEVKDTAEPPKSEPDIGTTEPEVIAAEQPVTEVAAAEQPVTQKHAVEQTVPEPTAAVVASVDDSSLNAEEVVTAKVEASDTGISSTTTKEEPAAIAIEKGDVELPSAS